MSEIKDNKLDKILSKQVFHGLWKLKGEKVKLNIDKDQTPKVQPQQQIPYHIREKVKCKLEELEREDIIKRVPEDQPTP